LLNNDRYAAIDTGTNTILMVIGEKTGSGIKIINDYISLARLGEGVDESGNINFAAIDRACEILSGYQKLCKEHNVSKIQLVGTSALRDAKNSKQVLSEFKKVINADMNIISGETEAYLSFIGTVPDTNPSIVIDIGGGSTEIIFGENNTIAARNSFNIGAVRFKERYIPNHPPTSEELENTRCAIIIEFEKFKKPCFTGKVFAVAGTPTTLAEVAMNLSEYEPDKIHNFVLTKNKTEEIINLFLNSSITDIIEKLHIHPKRADVITCGAIILQEALIYLGVDECTVSIQGLRYGVLKNLFYNLVKW